MHFITIVPLGLALFLLALKVIAIGILLLVAGIAWVIYVLFFKKESKNEDDEEDEMKKQMEEPIYDPEFYRTIGRIEAQLDALEKQMSVDEKPVKRRRKK